MQSPFIIVIKYNVVDLVISMMACNVGLCEVKQVLANYTN
jgi:hypothetical protein